jgi:hypothetical protein
MTEQTTKQTAAAKPRTGSVVGAGGRGISGISPKGVIAVYPGGPLMGRLTKQELGERQQ